MLNKGKILWCIWAGILVLLFLMSSTDLIIKEKKIEVYPISVIIEGDNDDYYVNFKKGMDQAAVEFHGDVSFITLYADHDQAQQMELVKREIRDGARAVILAPVKPEEAVRKLEDMNPGCPVILLGQSPDEGTALDTIGVDGREIGRLLGEAAASQASRDVPVYLFCGGWTMGTVPGSTRGSGLCWMSRGIITGSLRGKTRTHTVRPYRKQTLPEAAGLPL